MSSKPGLSDIIELQSLIEIHTKATHETWLAVAEAVEEDRLRVEIRSAGVIGIPYWHEAAIVQCLINGSDGRYHVEAVVLKQSGSTLWLHIPPILTRVDRRKNPRLTGAFPVSYSTGEQDGIAVCLDFGADGMRLRMSGDLPLRTPLDLYFVIPGDPLPLRVQAVVVHSVEGVAGTAGVDVGIQFTTIAASDSIRISRFCRLAPQSEGTLQRPTDLDSMIGFDVDDAVAVEEVNVPTGTAGK